jgi:hypothetical protein
MLDSRSGTPDASGRGIMKTTTALSLTVLLVAGCASDPNKQLKQATAEEATANRAQQEAQINATKTQEDTRLEAIKPDTEGMPPASQDRAKAQSAMGEERQKFENDVRARLAKVQGRLDEARQRLQLGGGNAPSSIREKLDETKRLADGLSTQLTHLPQVSNDGWSSEKRRIEESLGDLESSAAEVKSKADHYPK